MATTLVAINKDLHKDIRVKKNTSYANAQDTHLCLIQVHEFVAASTEYPLVFVKDPDTGQFRAVAMLGLAPSENLFYSDNSWQASYIPNSVQMYPWGLSPSQPDSSQLSLALNMDSDLVNTSEGMALFDEHGEETPYLKKIKDYIGTIHNQTPVTIEFIKYLTEKDLLVPQTLSLNTPDDSKPALTVNGIYTVDTNTLDKLSDDIFLTLRQRNYLPIIYAHLASLHLVTKLAERKACVNREQSIKSNSQ